MEAGDIRSLIRDLRSAKYFLAAETLSEITAPLLRKLSRPSHGELPSDCLPLLAAAERQTLRSSRQGRGYRIRCALRPAAGSVPIPPASSIPTPRRSAKYTEKISEHDGWEMVDIYADAGKSIWAA